METPRERLREKLAGFELAQAIYAFAKLRVADHLAAGPRTAPELAELAGAHPASLFRLLRYLANEGVLTQDPGDRFGLSDEGQFLRSDAPGSLVASAEWLNEELYRAAGDLVHTVRTGETAFEHMFGMGQFAYLAAHPESSRTFNAAMSARREDWSFLAGLVDLERRHLLVDVGGGRGTVLAALLKEYTRLNGLLFDFPHVMPEADDYLSRQGVRSRCRLLGGSVLDFAPADADVYLAVAVLHMFPDPLALRALENIRRASEPDGLLLLVEHVLPPGAAVSEGKRVDLRMLYATGGKERTEAEWRELLERAGFQFDRVIPTGIPPSLIVATAPPDR